MCVCVLLWLRLVSVRLKPRHWQGVTHVHRVSRSSPDLFGAQPKLSSTVGVMEFLFIFALREGRRNTSENDEQHSGEIRSVVEKSLLQLITSCHTSAALTGRTNHRLTVKCCFQTNPSLVFLKQLQQIFEISFYLILILLVGLTLCSTAGSLRLITLHRISEQITL